MKGLLRVRTGYENHSELDARIIHNRFCIYGIRGLWGDAQGLTPRLTITPQG